MRDVIFNEDVVYKKQEIDAELSIGELTDTVKSLAEEEPERQLPNGVQDLKYFPPFPILSRDAQSPFPRSRAEDLAVMTPCDPCSTGGMIAGDLARYQGKRAVVAKDADSPLGGASWRLDHRHDVSATNIIGRSEGRVADGTGVLVEKKVWQRREVRAWMKVWQRPEVCTMEKKVKLKKEPRTSWPKPRRMSCEAVLDSGRSRAQ